MSTRHNRIVPRLFKRWRVARRGSIVLHTAGYRMSRPSAGVHRAPEDADLVARIVRVSLARQGAWL